jgi:two-component system, LuxR family, sensor kinase FixL
VLGELSGSLAHELNQPLTAILSNAQAAQRFLSKEPADLHDVREILGEIVSDDRRAAEIIHRLRQLFQRGEIQPQMIAVNELVHDALRLAQSELAGVDLRVDLADHLPLINGDRVQLQQLLVNLITNACNAMDAPAVPARRLIARAHDSSMAKACA